MSYYRLVERRRGNPLGAATRLEPDWLQRGLGVGLFLGIIVACCWAVQA